VTQLRVSFGFPGAFMLLFREAGIRPDVYVGLARTATAPTILPARRHRRRAGRMVENVCVELYPC